MKRSSAPQKKLTVSERPPRTVQGLAAAAAILASILLLGSCSSQATVLRIASAIPEVSILAELYQRENPGVIIQIIDDQNPGRYLSNDSTLDLAIDRELNNPAYYRHFEDLSGQDDALKLRLEGTYPFTSLEESKRRPLIMVSFDLPGILSQANKTRTEAMESIIMDLSEIKRNSKDSAVKPDSKLSSVYFSPLFNPDFILQVCRSFGSRITADRQGFPQWSNEVLAGSIQYLRTWSNEAAGSPDQEAAFLDRYAYIPLASLVDSGRMKTGYIRASEYFDLPLEVRQGLSFHYLSWNGHITVLDTAVYAGVCTSSKEKGQALKFLTWLMSTETQNKYLQTIQEDGIRSFGFLHGFSTLRMVCEKSIPLYDDSVKGMIAPDRYLSAPDPVPLSWSHYKDTVLIPFLLASTKNGKPLNAADLQERTMRWYLQQGFDVRY